MTTKLGNLSRVLTLLLKRYQVAAINTDSSKAFDSVCQQLILNKLPEISVTSNYIKWMKYYLNNHGQRGLCHGK